MKSIFKYTFVGLLSGTLLTTSCSEDQLNTSPTQYVSSEGMLSSATTAQTALNGIYREMFQCIPPDGLPRVIPTSASVLPPIT